MKKGKKWIALLILIILLLLFVILYLLFTRERSFTITFDTNGGNEIANVEVQNGEIVKLPESPKKEGHTFVGWTNKEGKIVTKGTKVTKDITLKAEWIKDDAMKITTKFDTDGGNEIENIIIEKGQVVLLPIPPIKEGFIFVGWVNENNELITEDTIITENIVLKAVWISEGISVSTIKFDTDGGNKISSIIVENGKIILLPVAPRKEGYVFGGWVDGNGNLITKDTMVSGNMTIKALWKSYTCPTNCTPIGDGSKCTKEVTTNMVSKTSCPSGSILYKPWYNPNKSLCIKLSTKVDANIRQCDTWDDAEVVYEDSNGKDWCVKTVKKTTSKVCPNGYVKSGSICKKTETVNCTLN